MKSLIAALALAALIAVPTFAPSANAAPVSPSSSAFGGNGYLRQIPDKKTTVTCVRRADMLFESVSQTPSLRMHSAIASVANAC